MTMSKLKLEERSKFLTLFGRSEKNNFAVVGKGTFVNKQTWVNHVYMITPKHLEWNPDSMYLGKEQIEAMEREHGPMCGQKRRSFEDGYSGQECDMKYEDHKYDDESVHSHVIECKRPITDDGKKLCKELLTFLKVVKKKGKLTNDCGFAFVDIHGKGAKQQ